MALGRTLGTTLCFTALVALAGGCAGRSGFEGGDDAYAALPGGGKAGDDTHTGATAGGGGAGAVGGTHTGGTHTGGTHTGGTQSGGSSGGGTITPECDGNASQCGDCVCDRCAEQHEACVSSEGCLAVLECAEETGCVGEDCLRGPCGQGASRGAGRRFMELSGCAANACGASCGGGGQGNGGGPNTGGNGGGGGGGIVECLQCTQQQCPEVQSCLMDEACRGGLICVAKDCLASGGFDMGCAMGCFSGDLGAAMQAVQGFSCVAQSCGDSCGSLLDMLGGGSNGGGSPLPFP